MAGHAAGVRRRALRSPRVRRTPVHPALARPANTGPAPPRLALVNPLIRDRYRAMDAEPWGMKGLP